MVYPVSYKDVFEQNPNEDKNGNVSIGAIEFESDEARTRYLLRVFPGFVKNGKFVEAMETVHGNESFNGLYRLFDKVSRWLVEKTEQKAAKKDQTVQEHILDQTA